MEIPIRYLTLPKNKSDYVSTRSLSESIVKRELKRRGYKVTRGSMMDCLFEHTRFDEHDTPVFVRWKLLRQLGVGTVVRMAKYCSREHGTPDFLAAHAATGVLAIEVKLGQESVKPHQLQTMRRLTSWGVPCEIWRVMPKKNKVRQKSLDLDSWSETGDLKQATEKVSYERSVTVYGKR